MGKDAMKTAWLKWVVTGALALAVMPTVPACGDDDDATGDTTGSGPTGDDDDATNTTGGTDTGATGGTGDDDATDTTGAIDTSGTGGTDSGGTDTGGSTIGYVEDIQPLIKNDCLSCHGAGVYLRSGEGILLETQADVYRLKASVVNEVVRGKMPEGAPYDQATRNLFAAWRTAGYPVNRGE
jgi:hypothetical protein